MGGTLLLADDSITIQEVVELTFAETDHAVVAVGNGRDLLQRLAQVKPDVVLCDVVMPDMNGYDVCQALKSDPNTLRIPVILLTGTFEPFDRDRALAAGCDAIVTKPFEARELECNHDYASCGSDELFLGLQGFPGVPRAMKIKGTNLILRNADFFSVQNCTPKKLPYLGAGNTKSRTSALYSEGGEIRKTEYRTRV